MSSPQICDAKIFLHDNLAFLAHHFYLFEKETIWYVDQCFVSKRERDKILEVRTKRNTKNQFFVRPRSHVLILLTGSLG